MQNTSFRQVLGWWVTIHGTSHGLVGLTQTVLSNWTEIIQLIRLPDPFSCFVMLDLCNPYYIICFPCCTLHLTHCINLSNLNFRNLQKFDHRYHSTTDLIFYSNLHLRNLKKLNLLNLKKNVQVTNCKCCKMAKKMLTS